MPATNDLFEVEWQGPTAVVSATRNLGEADCEHIEEQAEGVLALLEARGFRDVLVDLGRTDYVGSTALGFFVRLWKEALARGGRMALCNASAHEAEILRVTVLDGLWPAYASREEGSGHSASRRTP